MDKIIILNRFKHQDKQTLGNAVITDKGVPQFSFITLELPWKDNKPNISCIPKGTYKLVKRNSLKYGNHFHVLDVPGRSMILIHAGNYYRDIQGCILPGDKLGDINADGYLDVLNSKVTLKKIWDLMPSESRLIIS